MIVVHIESGLGNQMLSYCELLAARKMNPNTEFYIENIVYDIPECNNAICQWNGYELERIFGIKEKNIKSLFTDVKWNEVVQEILESKFWNKNWNYPRYFISAFANNGLKLINLRGDFEVESVLNITSTYNLSNIEKLKCTWTYQTLKRLKDKLYYKTHDFIDLSKELFFNTNDNVFTGQRLDFKYKNSGINKIENIIREIFVFPAIIDKKNKEISSLISSNNSIAIHARRGDMLTVNKKYYASGYFKRAVKYIKQCIVNPIFILFSDPESINWCKENEKTFGLDFSKDTIMFIDWNSGKESYRDMQLMAQCKHNIITNSSFGWWGAYLNENPKKITISPEIEINTTHHF